MIRTRYCSNQSYPEFKAELESKGHTILDKSSISGVTQVVFREAEKVNDLFEESLIQLRNGNTSEGE